MDAGAFLNYATALLEMRLHRMTSHSPVLKALAQLFARSQAGRKDRGQIDFQPELKAVLRAAGSEDGEAREQALKELSEAEASGLLQLERHRRDPFFFQAEDGIRDVAVTGVQTCALPI